MTHVDLGMQVEGWVTTTTHDLPYMTHSGAFLNGKSVVSSFAIGPVNSPSSVSGAVDVDFTVVDMIANGINVRVDTGGLVGTFSILALVLAVTSGLVLSQAAGFVVQVRATATVLTLRLRLSLLKEPDPTVTCSLRFAVHGNVSARGKKPLLLHCASGRSER